MHPRPDSRAIAAHVAMQQLEAMAAPSFDLGVKRRDGTMLVRESWGGVDPFS
jgi:hypothetical protein